MQGIAGGHTLLDIGLILKKVQIGEEMKVADLGCGASGHFVFPCANLVGKKGKVYAVDILKSALDTINRRVKQENVNNVIPVWSNLEMFGVTKIESGSLDVALLINTLFQSCKRIQIIRETIRILKKDGKLIVVEWKNIATPFGPLAKERVNLDLLKREAHKIGLKLEDEFNAGPYHYGLIFSKL